MQLAAYRGGERAPAGAAAGPAQQGPVQERADKSGVPGRLAGQVVLKPGRDALDVLVALGQDPGLHQGLPEIVQAVAGRQLVQQVVGDGPLLGDQVSEEPGGGALPRPLDGGKRRVDPGECLGEGPELGCDGTVSAGEQLGDLAGEDAVGAPAAAVGVSRPPGRIVPVRTGCCPHTAIRDDIAANLDAVEDLEDRFGPLDLVIIESGGDNLTATFSRGLADAQIFVLDVSGGDKVPRKGGPGVTTSDLLVINKTDLAPLVGASLEVMNRDATAVRDGRPVLFTSLREDQAAAAVADWVRTVLRDPVLH